MTTTVADNKTVITEFIDALNHGLEGGTEWVRYLSPQVIDHNKIIFGEEDTPAPPSRASVSNWPRSAPPRTRKAESWCRN